MATDKQIARRLDKLFDKKIHTELLTVEERIILGLPTTDEERLNWRISTKQYLKDIDFYDCL